MYTIEPGTPLWKYPEPDMSPPDDRGYSDFDEEYEEWDDDLMPLYCEEWGNEIIGGEIYYVWGRTDEVYLCEKCMEEAQRAASRVRGEED